MTPSPGASGVGESPKPATRADILHINDPMTIQQRIDALLIAWQYAGDDTEKQNIQQRIDALQIALEYA